MTKSHDGYTLAMKVVCNYQSSSRLLSMFSLNNCAPERPIISYRKNLRIIAADSAASTTAVWVPTQSYTYIKIMYSTLFDFFALLAFKPSDHNYSYLFSIWILGNASLLLLLRFLQQAKKKLSFPNICYEIQLVNDRSSKTNKNTSLWPTREGMKKKIALES